MIKFKLFASFQYSGTVYKLTYFDNTTAANAAIQVSKHSIFVRR